MPDVLASVVLHHVDIEPAGDLDAVVRVHIPHIRAVERVGGPELDGIQQLPRDVVYGDGTGLRQIVEHNLMLYSDVEQCFLLVRIRLDADLRLAGRHVGGCRSRRGQHKRSSGSQRIRELVVERSLGKRPVPLSIPTVPVPMARLQRRQCPRPRSVHVHRHIRVVVVVEIGNDPRPGGAALIVGRHRMPVGEAQIYVQRLVLPDVPEAVRVLRITRSKGVIAFTGGWDVELFVVRAPLPAFLLPHPGLQILALKLPFPVDLFREQRVHLSVVHPDHPIL